MRGICALRPGVPGMSETIRVRSVLGRFLEHSRVFAFGAGEDECLWIGSADMMHRNLDRRVEVLVRVRDRSLTAQLRDIIALSLDPEMRAWDLQPDGSWSESGHLDAQQEMADRMAARGVERRKDA